MGIFTRLAEFDGKSNATLKSIKRSTEVSTELLTQLIDATGGEDAHMQMGATWLLRAYLEEGARLDAGQVERLSDSLAELHDGFGRIHICQSMHLIEVPEALAETFRDFFRSSRGSKNTFLRAWAPSGFWHLAAQHPRYEGEAREMVAQALSDPAASVRARARRILAGE